jgi:phosphatidate cytidylyltransferase
MNSYPYTSSKNRSLILRDDTLVKKSKAKWTDIKKRTLTALIAAPLTLAIFFLGSPYCDILFMLVAGICAFEASTLFGVTDRLRRILYSATILAVVVGAAYQLVWGWAIAAILMLVMVASTRLIHPQKSKNKNMPYLLATAIYIGASLGFVLSIRSLPDGLAWVFVLAMNIWGTDTFALLGGRMFGRTPLAPRISPKKTWEGAATGAAVGITAGTLMAWATGLPVVAAALIGLAVVISTIVGDLVMSSIKRRQGVKDTGTILPGHGGLLDRLDGVFLSVTAAYTLMLIVGIVSMAP